MSTARASMAVVALCAAAIYWLQLKACARPAPPAKVETVAKDEKKEEAKLEQKQTDVLETRGPIQTTTRVERRSPSGAVTTRTVVKLEAPVRIEKVAHLQELQEDHAEERTSRELRTIPAPVSAPPRWSLSLSIDNALDVALTHSVPQFRAGAGVRLVGPVWFDVSVRPPLAAAFQVGAGISVRW